MPLVFFCWTRSMCKFARCMLSLLIFQWKQYELFRERSHFCWPAPLYCTIRPLLPSRKRLRSQNLIFEIDVVTLSVATWHQPVHLAVTAKVVDSLNTLRASHWRQIVLPKFSSATKNENPHHESHCGNSGTDEDGEKGKMKMKTEISFVVLKFPSVSWRLHSHLSPPLYSFSPHPLSLGVVGFYSNWM